MPARPYSQRRRHVRSSLDQISPHASVSSAARERQILSACRSSTWPSFFVATLLQALSNPVPARSPCDAPQRDELKARGSSSPPPTDACADCRVVLGIGR